MPEIPGSQDRYGIHFLKTVVCNKVPWDIGDFLDTCSDHQKAKE